MHGLRVLFTPLSWFKVSDVDWVAGDLDLKIIELLVVLWFLFIFDNLNLAFGVLKRMSSFIYSGELSISFLRSFLDYSRYTWDSDLLMCKLIGVLNLISGCFSYINRIFSFGKSLISISFAYIYSRLLWSTGFDTLCRSELHGFAIRLLQPGNPTCFFKQQIYLKKFKTIFTIQLFIEHLCRNRGRFMSFTTSYLVHCKN